MIRRATMDDAPAIHALLVECGKDLSVAGFDNWNPPAPITRVEADIAEHEVYVLEDQGELIASVAVATEGKVVHMYRLAVKPARQGRGTGAWLTGIVHERARELGCTTIRLDALMTNPSVIAFYKRAGYQVKAEFERDGWRFARMEKNLA
jgi:ribosomal protein S18 acetylase RimI-like enzyme